MASSSSFFNTVPPADRNSEQTSSKQKRHQEKPWAKPKSNLDTTAIRQKHHLAEVQIRKQHRTDRLRQRRRHGQIPVEEQQSLLQACAVGVAGFLQDTTQQQQLDVTFRTHHPTTALFLQRFLEEHANESRLLAAKLLQDLQVSSKCVYALAITNELVAALAEMADAHTPQKKKEDEFSYYGQPPLRWEDLFFPNNTGGDDDDDTNIITILAQLLRASSKTAVPEQQRVLLLQSCWKHWIEYAPGPALRATLPQYWSLLVAHLPMTTPCCAAIVTRDQSQYGMDLLTAGTFDWPHLLLVQQHSDDGRILLEGLCRRESAVGDTLCCDPAIVQAICAAQPPLLRVLQYVAPGHAELFAAAIPGVVAAMDCGELDAIAVLHMLQGKAAVPRLVQLLVSRSHTHQWKCEAVHSLATASEDVAELYHVSNQEEREELMRVLVQLLKVNDTALPSLTILDRILRSVPDSLPVFEESDGVELLESFSLQSGPDTELSNMAGNLVDDLFDTDMPANTPSVSISSAPFTSFSFAPPQGRGRGRTIPAWQQQG